MTAILSLRKAAGRQQAIGRERRKAPALRRWKVLLTQPSPNRTVRISLQKGSDECVGFKGNSALLELQNHQC